jgi:vancomycin resistance protein YoaR
MGRTSRSSAKSSSSKRPGGQKRKGKKLGHLSVRGVAIFLAVFLVGGMGVLGFISGAAAGRIADGVTVGPVVVGGLTPAEAKEAVAKGLNEYELNLKAAETEARFNPFTTKDDQGRSLAHLDLEKTVNRAYQVGRGNQPLGAALERIVAYLFGHDVGLPVELSQAALISEMKIRFAGVYAPAVNASLEVTVDSYGEVDWDIRPEREGTDLDTKTAAAQAEARLKELDSTPVIVKVEHDEPELTKEMATTVTDDIDAALARGPLSLTADDQNWTVSRSLLASWLDAVLDNDSQPRLGFNQLKITKHLESKASALKKEPIDAIFEMEDGRVTRLEPHQDGQALDIEKSIEAVDTAVFGDDPAEDELLELPLKVVSPQLTTEQANPYGIKEVLGVGATNFRGSPYNRRINISVGATSLNGLVIQPDTEFSLIEALGEIDGEHGYKQELVIKGDETKPEYGGGLCQIGTTTFRAVMAAGLRVIERQNHSYRVPYYERDGDGRYMGPGKDATIYDPWPDFKFKNDTANPVVLMTDIDGNKLEFTFWGASDGRTMEQSDVSVWNVEPPPEKKTIPTDSLPPGEEKCTESPHPGASTVFTYTVNYPNGETNEEKFYSRYRPWGEVCLIGIDPDAPPIEELPDNDNSTISADASGATGD